MRYTYSQSSGDDPFLSPDDLFPSQGMLNFLLQYGQDGLDALDANGEADEQLQAVIQELIDAGLIERDDGGNLKLTPRMVRGLEHRALLEIFRDLRPGVRDGHQSPLPGRSGERTDGTKPYQFGDPLSELAAHETLSNAIRRAAREGLSPELASPAGPLIRFEERDIELNNVEATSECATVVLLDLSGSMMRYGRHVSAKKVALGLRSLVRTKFPLDTIDFIGFASVAEAIRDADLPLIMPKPISTRQYEIRVRVPLDQADKTHPHFTNLHHGLQMARAALARRGAPNKQIFIITDGEPTAHLTSAKEGIGQTLNLIYPPDPASSQAALQEALRCQQLGIRMSTFALIEEYHGMDWVGFVEQFTRLTRGVAYYCTAGDLSATLMESYLTGKKKRQALG
ncbi:MAG: hypothetical protein K2Q20_13820 [Phycisphaerales bacterium]|nr:hypothetical protein [Phycisphaerales bacterium]